MHDPVKMNEGNENGENMKNDRREMPELENWLDNGTEVGNEEVKENVQGLWNLGAQERSWQSSSGVRNGVANCLQCPGHNSQMPLPFMCTPASLPRATPTSLAEVCLQSLLLYSSTQCLKAHIPLLGVGVGGVQLSQVPHPLG